MRADGKYYRVDSSTDNDGATTTKDTLVCEDCWGEIPKYVDFPRGLVSPESDGDLGGNFVKTRPTIVGGLEGIEHMQKAVCLPCYLKAFERHYPKGKRPKLSDDVMEEKQAAKLPPLVTDLPFVDEPRTL